MSLPASEPRFPVNDHRDRTPAQTELYALLNPDGSAEGMPVEWFLDHCQMHREFRG